MIPCKEEVEKQSAWNIDLMDNGVSRLKKFFHNHIEGVCVYVCICIYVCVYEVIIWAV